MTTTTVDNASNSEPNSVEPEAAPAEKAQPEAMLPEGSVTVSSDDAATLDAATTVIAIEQQRLGRLREEYHLNETAALNAIMKARQDREGALSTLAKKHNIDISQGQWVYLQEARSFVPRQALQAKAPEQN